MKSVQAEALFDLQKYQHRALFANCHYAWEALANIAPYLSSFCHSRRGAVVSPQAFLVDVETITLGPNTVVEAGAYIAGPCIIGSHCTIRHGAYIRGQLITGDHCIIGHSSEVKNTIMLDSTQASHFAYVGDSILGNHVNLGAGSKLANLKFDHSIVQLSDGLRKYSTGLRKCGAMIGDGAQLGCNSVTLPGTVLGKYSLLFPTVSFGGVASAHSVIKSSAGVDISSQRQ